MPKTVRILFFCMIFVSGPSFSQSDSSNAVVARIFFQVPIAQGPVFSSHNFLNTVVPPDFYARNLGFFCKKEIKLEALTGIPFRFRLGSVDYCDQLEGKKNAGFTPAY